MWLCVMEKSRTKEKRNRYSHKKKKICGLSLKLCEAVKRPKTVQSMEQTLPFDDQIADLQASVGSLLIDITS